MSLTNSMNFTTMSKFVVFQIGKVCVRFSLNWRWATTQWGENYFLFTCVTLCRVPTPTDHLLTLLYCVLSAAIVQANRVTYNFNDASTSFVAIKSNDHWLLVDISPICIQFRAYTYHTPACTAQQKHCIFHGRIVRDTNLEEWSIFLYSPK